MKKWASIVGLIAVMALLAGCTGAPPPKMASKVNVSGDVLLDGQAMAADDAEISFIVAGEGPVTLPIKNGKFEGQGPIGEARVEIRAWRQGEPVLMDGKPVEGSGRQNYIAEQFNDNSTLTAKIEAGGTTGLKFDVESKK